MKRKREGMTSSLIALRRDAGLDKGSAYTTPSFKCNAGL